MQGSQFLAVSRAKTPEESKLACENVQTALTSWRRALPDCLQVGSHDEFNIDNFWVLILHARSYLISCLAWRTLLIGLSRSVNLELRESTSRKLSGVKFELGAVIDRLMIHNVTQYCPLAM